MTNRFKFLPLCLFVTVCFVTASLSIGQAQVTLTVGDGSGFIGSTGNITVSLNNPSENIRAIDIDVCDVDDYLSCTSCETTTRTENFACNVNEREETGCVTVAMFFIGEDVIEKGDGPIFTLNCDVSSSAPSGECRAVDTENEQIANENGIAQEVSSAAGDFCFNACSSAGDCDDGLYCNGVEVCTDDVCQPGSDPCPGTTCNETTNSCEGGTITTTTTTTTTEPGECAVSIACEKTELCPEDDCTTCTAVTECDGDVIDGTYEWELNDEVTGDTGDTIEICPEDLDNGLNTVKAFDTTNGGDDSEPVILGGSECESDCAIDVIRDSLLKSHWLPLPIVFRIETFGIDSLNILSPVTIECEADGRLSSILQTGKYIQPNLGTNTTVIWQSAIIWPALFTQSLGMQSEICAVTIGDCQATDTFELEYLSFIGIPLSE